jgi:hypothetical protein
MAQNTGSIVVVLGMVGVGGYLLYEYGQYNNAISGILTQAGQNTPTNVAALEAQLPFFTYLQANWGMTTFQSGSQAGTIYAAILQYLNPASAASTATAVSTPGTTPSGQVPTTTVSTTPTTTPTTTQGTPAPATTQSTLMTLANNMQSNINMTTANPDQWDVAFSNIMGTPIDQKYNFNFDTVYGPATQRANNQMSALTFLQIAASAVPGGLPGLSGLGLISRFPVPSYSTAGNMMYLVHHPLPYTPTYRGFGAFTQTTGFERALVTGRLRQ